MHPDLSVCRVDRAGTHCRSLVSLGFDIVAEQEILIADVQLAVGDDRMGPGRLPSSVRLLETATLDIFLRVRLDQEHDAVLHTVVESPVCKSQ